MSDLRCDDVLTLWNDRACGQAVSPAEQSAVDDHLAGCESCRLDAAVAETMRMEGPLGPAVFAPAGTTRAAFVARALERAADRAPGSGLAPPARAPTVSAPLVGLWIGVAAMVALTLGAVAFLWVYHGGAEPEPTAEALPPVTVEPAEVAPVPEVAADELVATPLEPVEKAPAPQRIGTGVGKSGKGAVESPAQSKKGRLTINSEPWSEVYLNGKKIGNTPIVFKPLPAGTYTVNLRVPSSGIEKGYKIKIKPGATTTLLKNLEADEKGSPDAWGGLNVQTKPWTTVHIDGRKIKNTPVVNLPLKPGTYSVTVENEIFGIEKTYRVKIRPGETTTLVKTLK